MKNILTIGLACTALAASAQLPEAIKLTENEQFEKATTAFKHIVQNSPNSGEAWFYLGENYYANDQADSAEAAYLHGIQVNPNYSLNYAGMGKVLRDKGDINGAQAQFAKASEVAELKANKNSKQQIAATYREEAQGLLAGKSPDYAGALALLQKAIDLYPKDPEAYIIKGDALFDQNPRDGTTPLENYKSAMALAPLSAEPVARKAFMYYRAKNFTSSIDEYTNAIALDPNYAPAYRGRAEAYFMARNFDKATADMQKYLQLNTGSTSARVRNAQFLFLVKKYDESLSEIQALEQEGVKNMTLKRLKAFDLEEKGQFDAANTAMKAYFAEQLKDKVISLDYEYQAKIYQGLAKELEKNPPIKIVNGTAVVDGSNATVAPAVKNLDGTTTLVVKFTPYDSLAAEMYLKAARMDASKNYLFLEAAKAFTDAKAYGRAVSAMQEKAKSGQMEVNDWYYLGAMANRAKMFQTADSAWTVYISKQPNIYQGYLYRARSLAGMDTADVKSWLAKDAYAEVIRKMKPEEQQSQKADLEEAYNYMGLYFLYDKAVMDRAKAKCWFLKVSTLNAGTSITKQVNDVFLKMKELKGVEPATDCNVQ
ncbi:MAG: tetratricopeptide repeat protein [Bacteroidetes bacterium]|nr:tetratricopeptide repeat protein [Bacteroidota bacterium]MBS1940840.1 tetratricopeptide repeat protein [Bacteroidota bacterium]